MTIVFQRTNVKNKVIPASFRFPETKSAHLKFSPLSDNNLILIRSFMDEVEIRPSQTGTEIKLIKHVHGPSGGGKEVSS